MASVNEMISAWLETKFKEEDYTDVYLVELNFIASKNKMEVFLEADGRLDIGKCAKINRYLQNLLDENGILGEKYTLDVSSPGVGKPLKLLRQYKKNLNRKMEVWLLEGKPVTGVLQSLDDDKILIVQEKRKGKKKEFINHEIAFDQIKRAVVKISF